MNYITDAVRALIGLRSDWIEACHPVEASEVRRFFQALMDPNPRYWDAASPAAARYGGPVAPPGFAVHAFRRPPDEIEDPLGADGDPEFDGTSRLVRRGLPRVPVPLRGVLNGGYEYEFFSYPRLGERILCRSAYRDITQREGRSGPMVLIVVEDEYATAGEFRPLLKSVSTLITR